MRERYIIFYGPKVSKVVEFLPMRGGDLLRRKRCSPKLDLYEKFRLIKIRSPLLTLNPTVPLIFVYNMMNNHDGCACGYLTLA
jgi:hypothetical protein